MSARVCSWLASVIVLVGCSSSTVGSGPALDSATVEDDGRSDTTSADVDESDAMQPDTNAEVDSAVTTDSAIADSTPVTDSVIADSTSSPDAMGSATDPKNCGAPGHDCLGATCSAGLCAAQEVRSAAALGGILTDLQVAGDRLTTITNVSVMGVADYTVRQGSKLPGAMDAVVGNDPDFLRVSWSSGSGVIVARSAADPDGLHFALPSGTRTTLATAVDRETADGSKFYFVDSAVFPGEIRSVGHSGGTSATHATGLPTTGIMVKMANDANDVCVAHTASSGKNPTVYCAPKAGGAATLLTFTGMSSASSSSFITIAELVLTPTRVLLSTHTSVSCSSGLSIWSAPRAGGAATLIHSDTASSLNRKMVSDGTNVYWLEMKCVTSGSATTRVRRAPLGGGAIVEIAAFTEGQNALAVDESYVYYGTRSRVFRVAK